MLRRIIRRLIRGGSTPTPTSTAPTSARPTVSAPERDDEPEDLVDVEVDTEGLKGWVTSGEPFTLVDIREPHELRLGFARDALLLRMNDIPNRLDELPSKETRLVIYCAAGSRSFSVAHWLREKGWEDTWSLESGFYGVTEAGFEVARPDDA